VEVKKEYMPYMKDIFQALPQTFFLKDAEGKYAFASKICELVNGGPDGTLIGKKDSDIQYDKTLGKRYEEEDQEILKTGISTHTIDMVDVQGEKHYIEVMKNPIYNDDKDIIGIIGICNDVTELVIMREKYEQLSLYDSLTGLYNRNYIVKFNFENETSMPCSYIVCDCNGLKMINDQFGHTAGDQHLCKVASMLKEAAYENSVVIRWGGDEFVVVTPGCSEIAHRKLIDAIRRTQEKYMGNNPYIGLAVGGAVRTSQQQSETEILKLADERMYADKALQKKSFNKIS